MIVGLGLIGGSIALRLRAAGVEVRGVTRSERTLNLALRKDIISEGSLDLADQLPHARLVILAAPVRSSIELTKLISANARPGTIITDVCSSKRRIVNALNRMPVGLKAVGGHPMAGKETGGIENADPSLFEGCIWALTETVRTDEESCSICELLARLCGAHSLWVDAAEHDRSVAFVSHLPLLSAAALMLSAEDEAPELAWKLAASGFRDSTRLAAGPAEMGADLLLTNDGEIRQATTAFLEKMTEIGNTLQEGDAEGLRELLLKASEKRRTMYGDKV